ncbi:hypothetical protein KAZ93_01885 [Patescibacteria group bacterium]|nr:hypothetical protein [Patescibacteria group bacterium]
MYCKNCFGCVGLKNHEYCIFNKQYSKEDYEVQVAKIISHMLSPSLTREGGVGLPER